MSNSILPNRRFQASTILKYSPRKTALIISPIRGVVLQEAMDWLKFLKKGKSKKIHDLLKSAATNLGLTEVEYSQYKIESIIVEKAYTYIRYQPRARGRVGKIRRKYSRVKVALSPIDKKL
jgi:large subunit ribosomal protein L22